MIRKASKAQNHVPDANQVPLRAHQTRSMTTSLALFQGATIPEIVQDACWENLLTCTSRFLRDVLQSDGRMDRQVLHSQQPRDTVSVPS